MKKTVFIALTLINISISASYVKNWLEEHNPFAKKNQSDIEEKIARENRFSNDPLVREGQALIDITDNPITKSYLNQIVNDLKENPNANVMAKKYNYKNLIKKQRYHDDMKNFYQNTELRNNFEQRYHKEMLARSWFAREKQGNPKPSEIMEYARNK